jgi:hypothetical protein
VPEYVRLEDVACNGTPFATPISRNLTNLLVDRQLVQGCLVIDQAGPSLQVGQPAGEDGQEALARPADGPREPSRGRRPRCEVARRFAGGVLGSGRSGKTRPRYRYRYRSTMLTPGRLRAGPSPYRDAALATEPAAIASPRP